MPSGYTDKPRYQTGRPPKDGNIIGSCTVTGVNWILYDREMKKDPKDRRWANLKLIASGKVPHKANYWLSYCLEIGDFRLSRDMRKLDINHPELLNWVAECVIQTYSEREKAELEELI